MSKDEDIKKFVETYKITFPVGKEKGIAEMLDARGIPTTVFISKGGMIAKRHIGPIKYAELVSTIEAMLK